MIGWTNPEESAGMPRDELKLFYQTRFNEKSNFQQIFNNYLYKHKTQSIKWNEVFAKELKKMLFNFNVVNNFDFNLNQLHNIIDNKYFNPVLTSKTKNTSRLLITDIGYKFIDYNDKIYLDFVKYIFKNILKQDFYFQKNPTIRFHFPHYNQHFNFPAWHCDSMLGHSPREINIWFSLTNNKCSDFWIANLDESRQWIESFDYDFDKWKSVCFSKNNEFNQKGYSISKQIDDIYNNIYLFDSRCIHSADYRSQKDMTTKISIDLRIILKKDYEWPIIDNKPVFVGDGIKKAEFRPGHEFGYHHKTIKEICEK